MADQAHGFGGDWTEEKLNRVSAYLTAYTTALKNEPFIKIYIDAFAGTGYRTTAAQTAGGLFEMPQMDEVVQGSARRALEVHPAFDRYVFIEQNHSRFQALKSLAEKYPTKAGQMEFRHGDANQAIVELCRSTNWGKTRAVLFLDPYGMQVDWATIETIATTKAIDLWYLVPAGIGIQRMLPSHGRIPPGWEARLDRMLGDTGWREEFYLESPQTDLFGEAGGRTRNADIGRIERYLIKRLQTVFPGVAKHGFPLRNRQGAPMYLLIFAAGNPGTKAKQLALRIAEHILKS